MKEKASLRKRNFAGRGAGQGGAGVFVSAQGRRGRFWRRAGDDGAGFGAGLAGARAQGVRPLFAVKAGRLKF